MEREIGEIFEDYGKYLQCIKDNNRCIGCFYECKASCNDEISGECSSRNRDDNLNVKFKEVKTWNRKK